MNFRSPSFQFLGLIVLIKLIYIAVGYCCLGFPENFSLDTILSLFNKNDSGWYQSIAENGYPKISRIEELGGVHKNINYGQSSWAFFPLYPMLVKSLCWLFNLSFNQSAFILSVFLTFLLILFIYKYIYKVTDNLGLAHFIVIFILAFPYALFLHVYYTESLYFLLVILSFYAIHTDNKICFSISLALLVLVRPNAVFTLIAAFLYYFELRKLSFKSIKNYRVLLLFLPSIFVLLSFLIFQKIETDSYFAFSLAQKGWDKTLIFPFFALFKSGALALQIGSVITLIFIVLLVIYFRKNTPSYNFFSWTNILLPLTAGTTMSMGRYILPIFPIFIDLGREIFKWNFKYLLLAFLFLLQIILYYYWLQSHPISY